MFFFEKKKQYKKIYYRKRFIYDIRESFKAKKKYFTRTQFATLRITRLFYIIYTYKQLKILCKKAKKMDGLFQQNYILLMECKLPTFIYRSSFLPNMFFCLSFIKDNNI
jgi:ribosomal protein S4